MLHNQDEIRKFDDRVSELHSVLNSASEQDVVSAVGNVMRILVSHDWPEWAPGHQWHVHPDYFEAFDFDDLEFLKRFVAGVVTVLKSGGTQGVVILQKYAASYLQQRGYHVAPLPKRTVTANQIAEFLGILRTSIPPKKIKAWGKPVSGAGSQSRQWMLCNILPVLQSQWPRVDWSKF